jgi:hypothetical protein
MLKIVKNINNKQKLNENSHFVNIIALSVLFINRFILIY